MKRSKVLGAVAITVLLGGVAMPDGAEGKPRASRSVSDQSAQVSDARAQRPCKRVAPPWMHNPRYMNRGMLRANRCRKRRK